jgi:hypothetical protein
VAKREKKAKTGQHGGSRPGSGKKVWFRGKGDTEKPLVMRMTQDAWNILDAKRDELAVASIKEAGIDVGRPDVVEALIRKHGRTLTLGDLKRLSKT